ncbi:Hypp379 [Branchiostoma lanceolatum]|uniref:Hypp379 protein n=1 Tax=Branchiostoma lanceolatum TaxID=7740 RepID=A0A8J9VZN5_BRALA|nr:Hypp379 [Branchiostoma lanceolatum]
MKPRQLGRVLMAAAFLLHVMVVLQQGQIFLTEEGVVRAVLDSDGSVTEKGNLRVHQVTSPDTMVVATTAGGGDDGRVRLVWCTVLRGEAREDRVRKYEGILKEVESGDRYFVRFLKVCRALRGPLAPEYDDVDPTPGVLGWGWWWMCDLFRTILRAVQDFCTWMVDIVTSAGLGPTLDPLDDLPVNDSSPKLTYARVAGQDRVFGRTKGNVTSGQFHYNSCFRQPLSNPSNTSSVISIYNPVLVLMFISVKVKLGIVFDSFVCLSAVCVFPHLFPHAWHVGSTGRKLAQRSQNKLFHFPQLYTCLLPYGRQCQWRMHRQNEREIHDNEENKPLRLG